MADIPVLPVDDEIARATQQLADSKDEIRLLEAKPPEQSDGMDVAPEMLRDTLHIYEEESKYLFQKKNTSPVCGMELWYDDRKSRFVFYLPNESVEQHYRQQLSGYYDQCELALQTSNEGKFIRAYNKDDVNEAMAVTRMELKKHYFMPVSSPVGDENELDTDPFKRILNQIDTKDDTRAMIQVLYKPAPMDWTDGRQMTLETKASRVQNRGGVKKRYFGLKYDEVEDTGIWENTASEMRSRVNKPSFFVNIRIAVVARETETEDAESRAKSRMNSLTNVFEHVYETRGGQGFTPKTFKVNEERNAKEILRNMINRKGVYMKKPRSVTTTLWRRFTPNYKMNVMTAGELAGLVHLPSSDAVTTDSISWVNKAVTGSVPPDADEFEPMDREERKKLIEDGDVPEVNQEDLDAVKSGEDMKKAKSNNSDDSDEDDDDAPSVLFDDN